MASASEQQCLAELCLQRKSINYEQLKEWDRLRAQELELHLKSVEHLTDYVDATLRHSQQYLEAVRSYLDSKADQYVRNSLSAEKVRPRWLAAAPTSTPAIRY